MTPAARAAHAARAWLAPALLVATVLSWLGVASETLRWIAEVPLAAAERRAQLPHHLGLVLLAAVGGLAFFALSRLKRSAPDSDSDGDSDGDSQRPLRFTERDFRPRVAVLPLVLLGLAATLHAALLPWLHASTPLALLFGAGTYALCGLYVPRRAFRAGLPLSVLLLALLPTADIIDSYFGFAARLLTTRAASQLLSALHVAAVPTQTALILERGLGYVDAPCSGLRGLWAGWLFYLGLTLCDRALRGAHRRLGLRWLLGGVLLTAALLLWNVVRVALLLLVGVVAQARHAAEVLHTPLGLIGFAMSIAAAALYLHWLPSPPAEREAQPPRRSLRLGVALLVGILPGSLLIAAVSARLAAEQRRDQAAAPPFALRLPTDLAAQPAPLTEAEQRIFVRFSARADKWKFSSTVGTKAVAGSLVAVYTPSVPSFRAHHPPEICLAGSGLRIESARVFVPQPGVPMRLLSLDGKALAAETASQQVALYWFQSPTRATDELFRRTTAQLLHPEPWVMISLLLSSREPLSESELAAFVQPIVESTRAALLRTQAPVSGATR